MQRTGRIGDAIAALDRLLEVNPEHPDARLRQGMWLIEAKRLEDAVARLSEAAANNPAQADRAATMIFNEAHTNGYQQEDFEYSITGMAAASQLQNLSPGMIQQIDFWHGFSVVQAASLEQAPMTLETANATLPKFQEALRLLANTGEYAASVDVALSELLANVGAFIETQEALIRRGRD